MSDIIPEGSVVSYGKLVGIVIEKHRPKNDKGFLNDRDFTLVSFVNCKSPYINVFYEHLNACWILTAELKILCRLNT